MYATPIPARDTIVFSPIPPPPGFEDFHEPAQSDVTLDLPGGVTLAAHAWPRGVCWSESILGVSRLDPKHYAVFRDRPEIPVDAFEESRKTWIFIKTKTRFHSFLQSMARFVHSGRWVAWAGDCERFLVAGESFEEVRDAAAKTGVERVVFEWVEPVVRRPVEAEA